MRMIIAALDSIVRALEAAVRAVYLALDFLLVGLRRLAQQILELLWVVVQLFFTLGPFVGMVILGIAKSWSVLIWIGGFVLGLAALFLLRELLGASIGERPRASTLDPGREQGMRGLVLLMNVVLWGYLTPLLVFDWDLLRWTAQWWAGARWQRQW